MDLHSFIFFALLALLLFSLSLFFVILVGHVSAFTKKKLPLLLGAGLSLPRVKRFFHRHPEIAAFLGLRLPPAASLALHLLMGLLVSLVFALVFAEIAEEIQSSKLVFVDNWALVIVPYLRSPPVTGFFVFVTFLGDGRFVASVSLIMIFLLFLTHRPVQLLGYVVATGGGGILNILLKALYIRSRPPEAQTLIAVTGWSFPSGHAMISVIFYGALVYILFVLTRKKFLRLGGVLTAFILIFLIGFSRIYLGVHYLTDVLGGYSAGFLWLVVSLTATGLYKQRRRYRRFGM